MQFTKMHGCGNDYIYVDCTNRSTAEELGDPGRAAVFLSDRHFGIGSDGLILIKPSRHGDFEMAMYNADGSRGEMCGNGIRCVAKYVYEHGLTNETEITVDTLAGVKKLHLFEKNGKIDSVKVDMGRPELDVRKIPVIFPEDTMINKPMEVNGRIYNVTCVSMGNPHCVTFLDEDVRTLNLAEIGPKFENHSIFPQRINTEFANVLDGGRIRMRVWERGSGETMACGTGACATAVAAIKNGLCGSDVALELLGGTLQISYDGGEDSSVYMTGPAVEVYTGDIDIPSDYEREQIKIYTI